MALHEELLILVPWLKTHQGITIPEVAKHFGYTEEQVKQYILLLGVVGHGNNHGELLDINYDGEQINVYDTLSADRPVRFDASEALCLKVGLQALLEIPENVSGCNKSEIKSALAKLDEVLVNTVPLTFLPITQAATSKALPIVEQALEVGNQVSFDYWNIARDDVTRRQVSPLRLRRDNDEWFLDAYCHTSSGWRSFRIDRMSAAQATGESSSLPAEPFLPMPSTLATVAVPAHRHQLLENLPIQDRRLTPDGRIAAEVEVLEPLYLARRVLTSGGDFEVLGPPSFVELVMELRSSAQAPYLGQ